MCDEKNSEKEAKKIDLLLENQSLEDEVRLRGGDFWADGEIDPKMKNEFLKNVMAFENSDKEQEVPMLSLFPADYKFPAVDTMSEDELSKKLDDMADILETHYIQMGFVEEVPDKVLYTYLVETYLPNEMISVPVEKGAGWVLSGCTGYCEECFQKDYCETGKELEESDDE